MSLRILHCVRLLRPGLAGFLLPGGRSNDTVTRPLSWNACARIRNPNRSLSREARSFRLASKTSFFGGELEYLSALAIILFGIKRVVEFTGVGPPSMRLLE